MILGARQTPYGVTYLVGWSDGFEPKTYSANHAHEKFPNLVIQFLENNIEFVRSDAQDQGNPIVVSQEQIGNPIEIICTFQDFSTVVFFLFLTLISLNRCI